MAGKDRRHRNSLIAVQSKGNLAMHDLDRAKQIRESSQNRLKRDVTDIESQEMSSMLSIRRDQRRLKEKLFSVQQSTGHYDDSKKGTRSRRRLMRKNSLEKNDAANIQQQEISRLPSLVVTSNETNKQRNFEVQKSDYDYSEKQSELKDRSKSFGGETKRGISKEPVGLPEMSKLSRSENTLNNTGWYANLDDVRSTIKQRLSISMNDLSKSNPEKELEPYLYAPPDGLPRTMYLMPSMDERFKQAMKARYIRKPGTRIDPVEKELDIKEIFDSSSYKK